MEYEEKCFAHKVQDRNSAESGPCSFPRSCWAVPGLAWARAREESLASGQPGISRAPSSQHSSELETDVGYSQALERSNTCRCPSVIPSLKCLKILASFSHFFVKASILLIEDLYSSSLHLSQSTCSISSRVIPQWLHSQLH